MPSLCDGAFRVYASPQLEYAVRHARRGVGCGGGVYILKFARTEEWQRKRQDVVRHIGPIYVGDALEIMKITF